MARVGEERGGMEGRKEEEGDRIAYPPPPPPSYASPTPPSSSSSSSSSSPLGVRMPLFLGVILVAGP
ncbi:hypothetical protein EYF80_008157 [Liparis tanakae]|uniref:Uncharacterized protein n=1 Tax=Liparis tanakae TaxID=230148 RepID=A0A4Z2IV58_9TELE|nr:hypothetical protein EYF80_008157 [Liparis tanakae]